MSHPRARTSSTRSLRSAALAALATMIAVPSVQSAVLTWDIAPGAMGGGDSLITGGAGTWDTTVGNWTTDGGVNNVTWVNNVSPDNAVFDGAGGVVSLTTGITAHNLTFVTSGYTVSGNTLTLGGTTPTIATLGDATVSSVIGGSAGLTKTGAGILTLTSANTYTGGTNVLGGTLLVSADNQLGGTGANNPITLDGGTLSTGANFTLNANHPIVIGANGGTLNGTTANVINFAGLSAGKLQGSGALTITGNGSTNTVLQISGAQSTFTGAVNINSARINLSASTATLGSGDVTIAGGSASIYANANVNLTNKFTIQSMGGEGRGAIRLNQGGTLSGPIVLGGDAGIHSDGTNTTTTLSGNVSGNFGLSLGTGAQGNAGNRYILTGANSHASTTVLGILNINSDAALGANSGTLTLNANSTLQAGAASIALNAGRGVVIPGAATIDTNGNDLSVAGIISGAGSLTKSNAGTLTLSADNTYAGATILNAGRLVISGTPTGSGAMTVNRGGILDLNYTADAGKIHDAAVLTLAGGRLNLIGGTHAEVVGSTTLNAGSSFVNSTAGSIIQMGVITRNPGASIDFNAESIATTLTPNDGTGMLGSWATINGADFAANFGGVIVAYTGYTDVPFGGAIPNNSGANVRLTGGTTGNVLLGATTTDINTLVQNQPTSTTIDLAGNTLRLSAEGVILVPAETGALNIGTAANNGVLTAGGPLGDAAGDLKIMNNSAERVTVNSVVADNGTGTVTFTKSGTETVVLAGTNTFTGRTVVESGTLEVGGGGSLGSGNYAGAIETDGRLLYSSSAASTLSGVISGSGILAKAGTGTLTLNGANTHSGGTTLNGGVLNVNSAAALGTGPLTLAGGTFDNTTAAPITISTNNAQNWDGDFTFAGTKDLNLGTGAVNLSGNRTVTVVAGNLTVGGAISGANGLTKRGDGTLLLNGANTYTGGTNVNDGVVQVSSTNALPTTGTVAIGTDGTVNIVSGGTFSYGAAFSGPGRIHLMVSATGDTNLSGNSTGFTGLLEISGSGANKLRANNLTLGPTATIKVNSGGQLFMTGKDLANPVQIVGTGNTENRGAIRLQTMLSGSVTLLGNATIGFEGGNLSGAISTGVAGPSVLTLGTTNSGQNATLSGILSDGVGTLAVTSINGIRTFSAANTYSGPTNINGGTLNLTGSIPNSALTLGAGAGLNGEGTAASLTTNGAVNLAVNGVTPGAFTSTGTLTMGGLATVTLNGTPSTLGPVTILNHGGTTATAANFALANSGNYRAPAFNVAANAVTLSLGGIELVWTGSGGSNWNVNSTANWSDNVPAAQKFFFGDAVTFNDAPGANQSVTLMNAVQPSTITVDNSDFAYTITAGGANVIAAGSLHKTGSNVLNLAGSVANTFSGGTVIDEGTINIAHGGSLGSGTVTLGSGTTLGLSGVNQTISNAMINNGGTINTSGLVSTSTTTFNNVISGTGGLTIRANGDTSVTGGGSVGLGVRLTGANTFTGDINVKSGLLSYSSDASFGNAANKIILDGGGLLENNNVGTTITREVEVGPAGGLFRTYGSTVTTLSGAVTGAGTFRHTDGGNLILSGDLSEFTGTFDNQAGTTTVTGAQTTGGSWRISAGTLRYQGSGTQVWENPISGAGALQVASGALVLNGANDYTGATNVTGGTLLVNGTILASAVSVDGPTAVLGGEGATGDVSVLNGGTVSPGTSTGAFSTGALTMNLGTTLHLEINGLLPLAQHDQLSVNGALNLGNATLSLTGSYLNPGGTPDLLFVVLNDGFDPIGGTFAGLPDGSHVFSELGQAYQISYSADFAAAAFNGGNDIALMPIPEPGAAVSLIGGLAMLVGLRRRRVS